MIRQSLALARAELLMIRRDSWVLLLVLVMPIILVGFMQPAFGLVLEAQGHAGANGAEQVVPGMAVMFSFFITGNVGYAFFREFALSTWDRLRAMDVSATSLLVGKLFPYWAMAFGQQLVLFAAGVVGFDLELSPSPLGMVLLAAALAAAVVAFSMAVVAFATRLQQVVAVQSIGTMVFAGLGGALVPRSLLPDWVEPLSPLVPSYWAMRGYQSILLEKEGLASTAGPLGVLLGFAALCTAAASVRFRLDEAKSTAGV